jgi:hypothetical protein
MLLAYKHTKEEEHFQQQQTQPANHRYSGAMLEQPLFDEHTGEALNDAARQVRTKDPTDDDRGDDRGEEEDAEQPEGPVTTTRPVVQRRVEPQQLTAALNAASKHVLRYDQLQDATNSFAASKVLGQGAFATVYLGQLGKRKVAVKKEKPVVVEKEALEKTLQLLEQQFSSEIQTLYRYHHPNICALLAHAIDGPSRCLVYEYCSNGTLYGKINPLTWPQRLRIGLGIARGLAYLHSVTPDPIVHR